MVAVALFLFGLALRVLFQLAGQDGGCGWHLGFQGDAPVWQELATKMANGVADDQLRLPWRPPGMQWLVALLWNGDPQRVAVVRWTFVGLGASVAPVSWLWLRRHTSPRVALLTAGLCAAASNLLLLGSGLHVEVVYLLGTLLSLFDQDRLAGPRAHVAALRQGLFGGVLCLLRTEHVLTMVVFWWWARRSGASWRTLGLGVAAAAVVLVPWQLHANAMVDAYNAGPQPPPPLPRSALPWDADAVAAVRALPSFQQAPVSGFVADTVRVRGGTRVTAADLAIVREAYGCDPAPLPHAFGALYGGLNFFLANTPEADGGFAAAALDRPPQLLGGEAKYPPGLRNVLPRGGAIVLGYPPHLAAVVDGTSLGLREIAADPSGALLRTGKKLWHAVEGMTGGLGGHALPIGLSGVRRQVDLTTATGGWAVVWRVLVLAVASVGLWSLRRTRGLAPLLLFAATKVVVVVVWFGYARQGALCLPVVALGVAALVDRLLPTVTATRARWSWALLATLLLAVEGLRAATAGIATVDGVAATAGEPFGATDFTTRTITFR